jgi:hypothetical protein
MIPAAIITLITEVIKIVAERISARGQYNTLTEDQARALALQIGQALDENLPTPEQLEQ